jgi:hypothetical protein
MAIKDITVSQSGLVGVLPSLAYIQTNDTEATVLVTGYLNSAVQQGTQFSLPCIAAVSTQASSTAQPQVGWYQVSHVGSNWSLVSTGNPGDVILPTTPNHIATYVDTLGTLSEDPAVAITGGALQAIGDITSGAGGGGINGAFIALPITTLSGSLQLAAVNNSSGNFNTIISNASAVGQSQTISIPDVGAATGNFLATGGALVSGNFPKASGTAGAMVDSGVSATSVSGAITQLGKLYQVAVTFNTAQMVTAYDTPLTIVSNPAASQVILVHFASVYTASTGHTAYATGTAPIIQYSSGGTNGAHGLGTIATASGLVAGDITASTSQVRNLYGLATAALTGLSGLGIYFSNATGDYTGGTGTSITITLVYELLTATI